MVTEEEKAEAKALGLEPEVVFNTMTDLTVFSVRDEHQNSIFEIAGYGLQVKFNRDAVKDVNDVECLLDGIKDVFRQVIMQDLLGSKNEEESK